jgi:hypothetical protein
VKTYESEITQFLRQLHEQQPDLEAQQRRNRSTWWERQPDPDSADHGVPPPEEPVKGYYYFPLPEAAKERS